MSTVQGPQFPSPFLLLIFTLEERHTELKYVNVFTQRPIFIIHILVTAGWSYLPYGSGNRYIQTLTTEMIMWKYINAPDNAFG